MTKNYLQSQKWKQKSPARAQTLPSLYLAQHISDGTSNPIILRQIKHESHHTFSGSQSKMLMVMGSYASVLPPLPIWIRSPWGEGWKGHA